MKYIDANKISNFEICPVVAGTAILDDEWNANSVKSPFSRLYFVKSGKANIICENQTITMIPDNVYLIPTNTEFSYSGIKDIYFEKVFFHISVLSDEYLDLLTEFKGIFSMRIEKETIEELFTLSKNNDFLSTLKIKRILYKTISDFIEKFKFDYSKKQYSNSVNKAICYIKNNLSVGINPQDIANEASIPLNSFRKIFKGETSFSLKKYIDNLIMNKAKYLLIHTGFSISKISEELGFSDQFYFSKRFKEIFGKSPIKYRKENNLTLF